MKKAFTLIELLVVVLIIGILSAVALPKYQLAVVKSRLAGIIPMMQGIKTGFESYYLANGAYPLAGAFDISGLDITSSCSVVGNDPSVVKCDNYFLIDSLGGGDTNLYVKGFYCPGYQTNIYTCVANYEFVYTLWLDHAPNYPGKRECTWRTDFGKRLCKTL